MNQITKKQHYIWRNYLAPWTNNNSSTGKITCLRNNKLFAVSLMNIAHENYFYKIKELSSLERHIIHEMTISNVTGRQREVNEGWLNWYCAPFDIANQAAISFYTDEDKIKNHQEFVNWNIEHVEKLHCKIEAHGIKYIEFIKKNDLDLWKIEKCRDEFSFFLCTQIFRTKNMRDSLTKVFEDTKASYHYFKDICPENMWLPLSLIFASNVGAHVTHEYSAVLLHAEENCFIVGDQPVVNTHSTFNLKISPNDMELFYPITPHISLLLTTDQRYTSGQTMKVGRFEVEKYNQLQFKLSKEQVFAKERAHLENYIF